MEKAVFHLQRAADAGNSFAQYQLGKIYLDEEYKNIPVAVQYLTLAADQKMNLRHTGWADFILWEMNYRRI